MRPRLKLVHPTGPTARARRSRTGLTAPRQQPVADEGDGELYGPTFAVPHEPKVPDRWHWPVLIVAVIAIAGVIAFAVVRASANQSDDPSLEQGNPAAWDATDSV